MAGIYKLQKEIKIKVFILQEDQFHSWLWAQRVPTLHWRLRGPITGHGSPAGARPWGWTQSPCDRSERPQLHGVTRR